ncbi:hypothetical protein SAMN04489714_0171 [Schaalia radingae]|uniref:Uncharacterized protein n=1 Tax=Schaalia radingae TaxID=131110 RepID=A0ABY0V4Y7_9ACTO|nr:hypothetical protein SAMN04489714_0171 [Schaalia radingae]
MTAHGTLPSTMNFPLTPSAMRTVAAWLWDMANSQEEKEKDIEHHA